MLYPRATAQCLASFRGVGASRWTAPTWVRSIHSPARHSPVLSSISLARQNSAPLARFNPTVRPPLSSARSYWWSSSPKAEFPSPTSDVSTPSAVGPPPPPLVETTAASAAPSLPPADLSALPTPSFDPVQIIDVPLPPFDVPAAATAVMDASNATLHFGDLAALGLTSWGPFGMTRWVFELIAASTGLPMWATIVVLTVLIRLALFPIVVRGTINNARLAVIAPRLQELQKDMAATAAKNDMMNTQVLQKKLLKLYKDNNVSLVTTAMVPLTQMPVAIFMYFAIHKMAFFPVPQFVVGGTAWFPDLTAIPHIFNPDLFIWWAPWTWLVVDQMWILPLVATAGLIGFSKWGLDVAAQTVLTGHMMNFSRLMAGLFFLFAIQQPVAVVLYFAANNILMMVQGLVLRVPFIRALLDLPPAPATAVETPSLRETWDAFKDFLRKRYEQAEMNASVNMVDKRRKEARIATEVDRRRRNFDIWEAGKEIKTGKRGEK